MGFSFSPHNFPNGMISYSPGANGFPCKIPEKMVCTALPITSNISTVTSSDCSSEICNVVCDDAGFGVITNCEDGDETVCTETGFDEQKQA